MIKQNKHIEIVSSTDPVLSSMGEKTRRAIQETLAMYYSNVGITIVNDLADLEALAALQPDLVVLGMKFIPATGNSLTTNKFWVSDYLEARGILVTGSDGSACAYEQNKDLSKQRMIDKGIMTSPFFVAEQNQPLRQSTSLSFPLFVKPSDRGGGTGIDSDSVVHDVKSMNTKIMSISNAHSSDSIVEEYLPGREFSVAILKDEYTNEYSVMPIELVAPPDQRGYSMLSNYVKLSDIEQILEVTDTTIRAKVCSLAMAAFLAIGARDYGRIDIRLDSLGSPHFLEANLLPSLVEGFGSFPRACDLNLGLNHESMIIRIVNLGLAHETNNLVGVAEPLALGESITPSIKVAFESA